MDVSIQTEMLASLNDNKSHETHCFCRLKRTYLSLRCKIGSKVIHSVKECKVLKWGLFSLPAYVANLMKLFAVFSGCNTRLLVGVLLSVCW